MVPLPAAGPKLAETTPPALTINAYLSHLQMPGTATTHPVPEATL